MQHENPSASPLSHLLSPRALVTGVLGAAALWGCGTDTASNPDAQVVPADAAETDTSGTSDTHTPPEDVLVPGDTTQTDAAAADSTATSLPSVLSAAEGRTASVFYPADLDPNGGPYPLALLLHGYGASAAIQDAYLNVSTVATARGWIVVIPEGNTDSTGKKFWNAGPAWCCDFDNSGIDDTKYLSDLIAKAKADLPIDGERVFVIGHSNGAYMAHRMACADAEQLSGIVAIAGGLPNAVNACAPSRPVALLQIHGTIDATVFYNGNAGVYPGSEEVADRWSSYNGCSTDPAVTTTGVKDIDRNALGAETDTEIHVGCPASAPVELWKMNGSGHIPNFNETFMPSVFDAIEAVPSASE